jgi:hypothetical protein
MSIVKGTLATEVDDKVQYVYPKTLGTLVEYDDTQNIKEKIDEVDSKTGNLKELYTKNKDNIVSSINEVIDSIKAATGENTVTTRKIVDGSVTRNKLSSDVKESLNKADSAVQNISEGSTNGTIEVDGKEVKVHGLGTAAFTDIDRGETDDLIDAIQKNLDTEVARAKNAENNLEKSIKNHTLDSTNPHDVTKEQIGLGNVKNVDTTDSNRVLTKFHTFSNNSTSDLGSTVSNELDRYEGRIRDNAESIQNHTSNKSNPHGVTKEHIGLGNVQNIDTSVDTNIATNYRKIDNSSINTGNSGGKSTVGAELNRFASRLVEDDTRISDHTINKSNPHSVTKEQIGLGNVKNVDATSASNISADLHTFNGTISTVSSTVAKELNRYENKIINMNNTINRLENRKFVFIGDSYGDGWTPDGMVDGWPVVVKNILGLSNNNCIISTLGGAGFNNGITFLTLLNNAITSTDYDVTDIIVCGGYNDRYTSDENIILSAIKTFIDRAKVLCPNAKVGLGFIGYDKNVDCEYSLALTYHRYKAAAELYGAWYLNGVEHSIIFPNDMSSDGLHPNALGMLYIARNICNCILSGSSIPAYYYCGVDVVSNNPKITSMNEVDGIGINYYNGWGQLTSQKVIMISFDSYNYVDAVGWTTIPLFKLPLIRGSIYTLNNVNVGLLVCNNGKYYNCNGVLYLRDGLELSIQALNEAGDSYLNLDNITQIQISQFNLIFNQFWG